MHEDNSCPVRFRLVPVGRDMGPYRADQMWADPDIRHAAEFMKLLVGDEGWRGWIAMKGQQTIRTHYSPQAAGGLIRKRLRKLGLLRKAGS